MLLALRMVESLRWLKKAGEMQLNRKKKQPKLAAETVCQGGKTPKSWKKNMNIAKSIKFYNKMTLVGKTQITKNTLMAATLSRVGGFCISKTTVMRRILYNHPLTCVIPLLFSMYKNDESGNFKLVEWEAQNNGNALQYWRVLFLKETGLRKKIESFNRNTQGMWSCAKGVSGQIWNIREPQTVLWGPRILCWDNFSEL